MRHGFYPHLRQSKEPLYGAVRIASYGGELSELAGWCDIYIEFRDQLADPNVDAETSGRPPKARRLVGNEGRISVPSYEST